MAYHESKEDRKRWNSEHAKRREWADDKRDNKFELIDRLAHDPVLYATRLLDLAHSKDVNEPGYEAGAYVVDQ